MDFRTDDVRELAESVASGERSSQELVAHALERIEHLNGSINAFVAVAAERAMADAAALDARVHAGLPVGPLAGIPIGVKDLEDAAGFVTTNGAAVYRDAPPAASDSALVARLRAAGCIVVGKTNTPEFGWTAKTDNTLFGTTKNPWNLEHTPAGSSGGSAAAVAAGMVPLATASDGGGSIRIPASACGLVGFKPSYGRIPTPEGAPGWLDLSSKGVLGRHVGDVVTALNVAVGPDPSDSTSLPLPLRPLGERLGRPLRVLWSENLGYGTTDAEVLAACRRTLDALDGAGVHIVETTRSFTDPFDPWLTIVGACLERSFAPFLETEDYLGVDAILQMIVAGGGAVSGRELLHALDARAALTQELASALSEVDVLLCPTTAGVAPRLDLGGLGVVNGEETINWVHYTYGFNMTRSPAASMPIGCSALGVPMGIQAVGNWLDDDLVLEACAVIEQVAPFTEVAPC